MSRRRVSLSESSTRGAPDSGSTFAPSSEYPRGRAFIVRRVNNCGASAAKKSLTPNCTQRTWPGSMGMRDGSTSTHQKPLRARASHSFRGPDSASYPTITRSASSSSLM